MIQNLPFFFVILLLVDCALSFSTRRSWQRSHHVKSAIFASKDDRKSSSRTVRPLNVNKSTTRGPSKQSGTGKPPRRQQVQPRPVVANYQVNRSDRTNSERLEDCIACSHFTLCSGCAVEKQVGNVEIIKSAKLYFSSTGIRKKRRDVIEGNKEWAVEDEDDGFFRVVIPSRVTGWRTQAKLVAAPKSSTWLKDGCTFGLYQRGTHSVLSIPDCMVHHPSINRAVDALVRATAAVGTAAYNEESREGGLRYVQLQVERTTGKICLTFVWNAELLKETQPSLSRLVKEISRLEPDLWHSMWCHCNDAIGNAIFSRNPRRWHRLSGPEFLREPIPVGDKGWFYFSPLVFRQGNMDGFDILANDVSRAIPGGSRVCELYAGVGVLGLTALTYHALDDNPLQWIRCSDENPANPRCFNRAVDSLPEDIVGRKEKHDKENGGVTLRELRKMMESGEMPPSQNHKGERTSYLVASAALALRKGQALGANVIIVDPPRKGLEDEVIEELCKPFNSNQPSVESATLLSIPDHKINWTNDVQKLIYVSCGFDALARDTERLLSSQAGWFLDSATGYVLFPGSDHVETVAIFTRK